MKYVSVDPKIKSKRFWGKFAVEQQPPPRILEKLKEKAEVILQLQNNRMFLITKNKYGDKDFKLKPEKVKHELKIKTQDYIKIRILVVNKTLRHVFAKNFSIF
ncbi:MAG: hypothetical protein ACOC4L_01590 [Halanaerobium sp.]